MTSAMTPWDPWRYGTCSTSGYPSSMAISLQMMWLDVPTPLEP
ncbi:Uncharacterised protein [Bordetella pertussis]|nr:Uncharacterised protein [Bordetella pertussis]